MMIKNKALNNERLAAGEITSRSLNICKDVLESAAMKYLYFESYVTYMQEFRALQVGARSISDKIISL